MEAIPSPLSSREEITGVSCPQCFGVLGVRTEGSKETLHFRCRIGHTFSASEVVVGKERLIEEHLWSAVTWLDELTTLLRQLVALGKAADAEAFEARARAAQEEGQRLRQVIQDFAPIRLPTPVEDQGGGK